MQREFGYAEELATKFESKAHTQTTRRKCYFPLEDKGCFFFRTIVPLNDLTAPAIRSTVK